MLDSTTKKRIDDLRNILVGKLPAPTSQVEQITTGLVYKFMYDMDQEAIELGGNPSFFVGDFQKYSWDKLFEPRISGVQRVSLYSEALLSLYNNASAPQFFRDVFKNSYLPFNDPVTLSMFLKVLNEFHYSHSEKLGDAFEYLLSFMGSQGDAGQFRTPRHIIDFIVEIINPKKDELILDPACGTAGFLISSYKHILNQNTNKSIGDELSAQEKKLMGENLVGYDISPDMRRISLVNMYLHQFLNPRIYEYDTLSSDDRWNEFYDVILANPPFFSPKGGIKPHSKFGLESSRAEVLFVDYILSHLKPQGRAGIIVPDSILFNPNRAFKKLRQSLINNNLVAILSLPPGIFMPYSEVKTSILVVDKTVAKSKSEIIFIDLQNDGYKLSSSRKKTNVDDFDRAMRLLNSFYHNVKQESIDSLFLNGQLKHSIISKEELSRGDISLLAMEYVSNHQKSDNGFHSNLEKKIEESKERVGDKVVDVWSVSNKAGFVKDGSYFGDTVASENISKYKIVKPNYYAYNPSRINVGSIALNDSDEIGCVSPMYVVFRLKDDSLDKHYLLWLLKSTSMRNIIADASYGSVRQQLRFKDLSRLRIPILESKELDEFRHLIMELDEIEIKSTKLRTKIESILDKLVKKSEK